MSERRDIAQRIAKFIVEHNLAQVFGGEVSQDPSRRSYNVGMSICRILDGHVKVFGPKFILVTSVGPAGDGMRVYMSEADAMAYLEARWVLWDQEKANKVPFKAGKSSS